MERAARMTQTAVDGQLIEACRQGDRDAYRALFELYKDRVYSIALHYTGNDPQARDVSQQVFLKLLTRIDQYDGTAAFSTWLYRIVANACIDAQRRSKHLVFVSDDEGSTLPDAPDPHPSTEEQLLAHVDESAVRAAVRSLAPKLRMAVLLRYYEELSYEEMAVALGVSKGTVASRLNRGHRILAEKLAHMKREVAEGGDPC